MNARQPMYFGPTANPHADAERWENEREARAEAVEARSVRAHDIALAVLNAATPDTWRKDVYVGKTFTSPDEMLFDALAAEDEDVEREIAALLCSTAALSLREALARYQSVHYAPAIAWESDR